MQAEQPRPLIPLSRLSLHQIAIALLAVGIAWRVVRYALGAPIWGDEAFVAISFLTRDYEGMLRPLEWGQIVPAGFMWLGLTCYRALGASEWALRLPSFLMGLAALWLYWQFIRRTLPRPAALLALGFLAAAHYPIRHASEVKPYACDLLVSLAISVATWCVWRNPRSAWHWARLMLLAALAPWLSYPSVFVGGAAGMLLTWLVIRERGAALTIVGWLVFNALFLSSFVAMFDTYGRAQAQFSAGLTEIDMWKKTFPPLTDPIRLAVWFGWVHTGNMLAYPLGGDKGASTLTFLLVLLGAARLWSRNRALLLLLLGPLPLAFVAGALHAYPYGGSARTMLYMAPAFCMLGGLGLWVAIALLERERQRLATLPLGITVEWGRAPLLRLAGVLLVAIGLLGSIRDVRERFVEDSPEDLGRSAVVSLASRARSGDRWVVFNATEKVAYAPWLGDWRGTGGSFVFNMARFHPVELSWAPPTDTITPRAGRTWVFAYRGVKIDFPDEQWTEYLASIARALGAPRHERFPIKERDGRIEAIDVAIFNETASASDGRGETRAGRR